MQIRLSAFLLAAALAVGVAHVAAQTDFEWRGALATGQTLEIKGINGDVRAQASASTDASVTAVKTARRGNPADVHIEVVPHAGGVTICAVYPDVAGQEPNRCEPGGNSKSHTRNNDTTVRFDVHVPVGVTFIGRTVNGSVEGDGLNGDAEGHTVNGSVRLTTTGTASGNTVNGSLNLSMGRTDWRDEAKFSTVNGSITLRLPAYLSANLHATTLNGEIESDFPITTTGAVNRRRIDGTIGNGGQPLTLSTVNGSVKLLRQ
jgi:putative adhesin